MSENIYAAQPSMHSTAHMACAGHPGRYELQGYFRVAIVIQSNSIVRCRLSAADARC